VIHIALLGPETDWNERITFACVPLADCLLGLYLLANGIESGSEEGQRRLTTLRARLTPEQMQAITMLFDVTFPVGALAFAVLHRLPDMDDAAALIAAIRALPDTEVVALALACAGRLSADAPRSPGVLQSLANDPVWATEYVRRFLSPAPGEPARVVATVTQPGQARQRLARLLDDLFAGVFAPLLPALASAAHIADARMRALFAHDPAAFVAAHFPRGAHATSDAPACVCWPSAFLGAGWVTIVPLVMMASAVAESPAIIVYGSETLAEPAVARPGAEGQIVPEAAPIETYQEVYRLLADPARWALIRLLVARPCYGQELSELLGLSIATVSHHLNGLKKLDLVRIEREEHRLYYHLRMDRLRALLAGAEQHLRR
jgi:DNA-binding transcriptional ArsR family regulator